MTPYYCSIALLGSALAFSAIKSYEKNPRATVVILSGLALNIFTKYKETSQPLELLNTTCINLATGVVLCTITSIFNRTTPTTQQ